MTRSSDDGRARLLPSLFDCRKRRGSAGASPSRFWRAPIMRVPHPETRFELTVLGVGNVTRRMLRPAGLGEPPTLRAAQRCLPQVIAAFAVAGAASFPLFSFAVRSQCHAG